MSRAARRHPDRHQERDLMIGYVRPDEISGQFADNLADFCLWDSVKGRKRIVYRASMVGGPRISETRNTIMQEFMKCTDAQWLLFADADMTFTHETVYAMLDAVAEDDDIKILGALAFAGGRTPFLRPVIYAETRDGHFELVEDYPEDSLCKVAATGCAFLLIHKSVAEAVYEKHKDRAHPWFEEGVNGKVQYGEDITFCRRARALGFEVYVHTGIEVGHMKMMPLHSSLFKLLRNLGPYERAEYQKAHSRAMGKIVAD